MGLYLWIVLGGLAVIALGSLMIWREDRKPNSRTPTGRGIGTQSLHESQTPEGRRRHAERMRGLRALAADVNEADAERDAETADAVTGDDETDDEETPDGHW